jgi:hypothetical protein
MSAEDVDQWAGRAKPGMPLFPGPAEIRETFIRSHGIDWTASYIDPAGWVGPSYTIVTRTHVAAERIRLQASRVCQSLGVTVCGPGETVIMRMAAE